MVPTLTWTAVCCQVAVTVAVAGGAAVDAAVVVVGAGVGPRVSQPGLSGRLPDVQQPGPIQRTRPIVVNNSMGPSQPMGTGDSVNRNTAQS